MLSVHRGGLGPAVLDDALGPAVRATNHDLLGMGDTLGGDAHLGLPGLSMSPRWASATSIRYSH